MAPKGPEWLTIKDAAEYLDVGEPTIYRWMRDGRITYRKVGDSTRFLEEDLLAMVQVHPSEKDTETIREFCPVCHHEELVEGQVHSAGRCYFRPDKARFWTWMDGNVPLLQKMCTRCGAVSWFGNLRKLEALRGNRHDGQVVTLIEDRQAVSE